MNRRNTLTAISASLLFAGLAASAGDVMAQSAKQLADTYSGVSFTTTDAAGNSTPVYGPNPRALLVLTADGHYNMVIMRESLPKFVSNSRLKGTAEENQAVIAGSLGHFGKYTIDEKDNSITFHIDSATFPNWDKTSQKRPLTLKADQFSYTTAATGGGTAEVVWKRVK